MDKFDEQLILHRAYNLGMGIAKSERWMVRLPYKVKSESIGYTSWSMQEVLCHSLKQVEEVLDACERYLKEKEKAT